MGKQYKLNDSSPRAYLLPYTVSLIWGWEAVMVLFDRVYENKYHKCWITSVTVTMTVTVT